MAYSESLVSCARLGNVAGLRLCLESMARSDRQGNQAALAVVASAGLPGSGWSAMHYSADRNDAAGPAMVALLLGVHADCNLSAGAGRVTPVMLAMDASCTESALLLLRAGAHLQAQDVRGWTPLHFASHRGNAEVVSACLNMGADAGALSQNGNTPIHLAAAAGAIKVIRVLLNDQRLPLLFTKGSLPYGDTPLHAASRHGHTDLALELVEIAGANPGLYNAQREDAPAAARRHGHRHTAAVLTAALFRRRRWWMLRLCALLIAGRAELRPPSHHLRSGAIDVGGDRELVQACSSAVAPLANAAADVSQSWARGSKGITAKGYAAEIHAATSGTRVDIELPVVRWQATSHAQAAAQAAGVAAADAERTSRATTSDGATKAEEESTVTATGVTPITEAATFSVEAVGSVILRLSQLPHPLIRLVVRML